MEEFESKSTLLVSFNFPPQVGGIETLMCDIISNLPGKRTVLAPWIEGCEEFDAGHDYETIRVKCPKGSLARVFCFIPHAISLVRKRKIQHIQSANIFAGVVSWLTSCATGVSYSIYALGKEILVLNTGLRTGAYKLLFKKVLTGAERILSISDYTTGELKKFSIDESKIFKIPSGIDTKPLDNFDPDYFADFKRRVLSKIKIENPKVILTVARLVKRKGQDKVALAMKKVKKRYPNAVYLIVGSGPEKDKLRKIIDTEGLSENVILMGFVPEKDIYYYYKLADMFVMASRVVSESADVEGFGQVFLEANYLGLPVVGGRSGGITDSVIHGKNGFLVDPESEDDIADKICQLLSSPELGKEMGLFGRNRVINEFNQKSTTRAIVEGLLPVYG